MQVLIFQIILMKNSQSNLKSPHCEETNTKIKLQINECETYKTIHNFTAWIYNLKKSTIKKLRAYISLKIKKLSQDANEMLISVNWESTKFIERDSGKL